MKKLLSYFFIVVLLAAAMSIPVKCKKSTDDPATEKMNGIEFTKKFKFELPFLDYTGGAAIARGKKQKAEAATLSVFFDLTLSNSAGVLTTSISPAAEWGGVQKWFTVDSTNNAVSQCNWNWSYTAAPATQPCNASGPAMYRSWTSDKTTYDVHLSPFLTIP